MTHRFINADGLVSTGTGILGHNMFAYCNNSPVNYSDPTGHCSVHTYYYMPSCPGCNPEVAKLHKERGADWAAFNSNGKSSHDLNRRPNSGEPGSTWEAPNGDKRTFGPDRKP